MRRYLVGLTEAELGFARGAVCTMLEHIGIEGHAPPAELAMARRLLEKLDSASVVTSEQVAAFERAADNLLDDPECVRDHRLAGAFAARSALGNALRKS